MSRYKNDYPANWKEIANTIKDTAGWRCVRCGHPHETPANRVPCDELCKHDPDGKQRILTVHHLDGDKANCAWYNAVALCQVCHLQIQGKVIMERTWFLPHSEWFRPYAAGYYAARHGCSTEYDYVINNLDYFLELGNPLYAASLETLPEPLRTLAPQIDRAIEKEPENA